MSYKEFWEKSGGGPWKRRPAHMAYAKRRQAELKEKLGDRYKPFSGYDKGWSGSGDKAPADSAPVASLGEGKWD